MHGIPRPLVVFQWWRMCAGISWRRMQLLATMLSSKGSPTCISNGCVMSEGASPCMVLYGGRSPRGWLVVFDGALLPASTPTRLHPPCRPQMACCAEWNTHFDAFAETGKRLCADRHRWGRTGRSARKGCRCASTHGGAGAVTARGVGLVLRAHGSDPGGPSRLSAGRAGQRMCDSPRKCA